MSALGWISSAVLLLGTALGALFVVAGSLWGRRPELDEEAHRQWLESLRRTGPR
ncbi:hypothetical protein [Streptomyces carpaticus]|uniref:hypothetical protein n=1 Tax=Streptomyces carpaticus TaxID=285558 RepID=UPI0031F93F47